MRSFKPFDRASPHRSLTILLTAASAIPGMPGMAFPPSLSRLWFGIQPLASRLPGPDPMTTLSPSIPAKG